MTKLLKRSDVWAWCLYDWANSAFVTSVITVVLPLYFLNLTPNGGGPVTVDAILFKFDTNGDALWGYITAIYQLIAGLASPIIGAMADQRRRKKRYLAYTTFAGALLTVAIAYVPPGGYQFCALLFMGAAFLWNCANVFYDGLLPDLASSEEEMDTISSAGYAFGYLGGGLLLAINLAMLTSPQVFYMPDKIAATQIVFVTVGVWWAVFALPLLVHVREKDSAVAAERSGNVVIEGVRRLGATLRKIGRFRQLVRLLIAFIFYNTGIGTIFTIAALYGKSELKLTDGTLIGCILMVQFIGVPAAFGFIALAGKLGTRNAIYGGLLVYIGVVVLAYFMTTSWEFWMLGVLVGLVQGGTQALSRSLYGSMIPQGHSAEFFGFFSIFNKVGSFAGPLCFAMVRDYTGSARWAILFVILFFVMGLGLLMTVNVRAGKDDARAAALPQ